MKAIQTKTKAAEPARKSAPFFKKGAGQGFFQPIQTKLTVNEPGDAYEKEADSTADRVVKGQQAEAGAGGDKTGAIKEISRKPIFDSKRDAEDSVQRQCAECEQEDQLQKKGEANTSAGAGGSTVDPTVESSLSRSKGGGSELAAGTRKSMESSLGADFSGVRIHQDSSAQQMNKALNAQAFTHGKDIYFDAGKYNPGNDEGKHLLAHELTHVVQQTGKGEQPIRRKPKAAAGQTFSSSHGHSPAIAPAAIPAVPLAAKQTPGSEDGTPEPGPDKMGVAADVPSIQRAPPPPAKPPTCGTMPPGPVSVADVTQNCPCPVGTIVKNGNSVTVTINAVKVKDNANTAFLASLTFPRPLPEPNSRKKNPTNQVSLWNGMVEAAVRAKLKEFVIKINGAQDIDSKLAPQNKYSLSLKHGSGIAALVGNFDNLVAQCLRPKWSPKGKPEAFQVEHIVDYQIAGTDADNPQNLMLLGAETNNTLGQEMAKYIRDDIQAILDHYNNFVAPTELLKTAHEAREKYTIMAKGHTPVTPTIPADKAILDSDMKDLKGVNNPLQDDNIVLKPFTTAPEGYFVLRSNDTGGGVILPYKQKDYDIGSYRLTMAGSEAKGIESIDATLVVNGPAVKDKPKDVNYPVTPVPGEVKVFRVKKFGYPGSIMKINYLSDVSFEEPEVDDELNLLMKGTIKTPTPKFLNGTPIEVSLTGRDLSIQKTFSPTELGSVGPIKVDNADLTLSLSTQSGFGASGSVDFSLPKNVAKGHIDASADKTGFNLSGSLAFDTKTFEEASIQVGYSSGKDDKENSDAWSFKGTLTTGKKVTGIDKASITVGYSGGKLTLKGDASLSVPGVKSVSIDSTYTKDSGEFSLVLGAKFDFKNKFIKDPDLTVKLATGSGEEGSGGDGGGLKLSVTGTMGLAIPHLEAATIKVAYDDGEFDAFFEGSGIQVGKYISGTIKIGVTNKKVDEATGAPSGKGEGSELHLYGQGTITVNVNQNIHPSVTVKLTQAGKILVSAEIKVDKQPLMPGEKLLGDTIPLFSLATPKIPIFSIGVGSIYLQIAGDASAMYKVGVPLLDFNLSMKDKDIFDPKSMEVNATVSPEISAEAGVDFSVTFKIGAEVLVLAVHADIKGTISLHAKATLKPTLNISWTPEKGLTIKDADVALDAVIEAGGSVTGSVVVDLDLWVKTIEVWRKDWTLAEMNFGDLGHIGMDFPIKFDANGNIVAQTSLKPKTPYTEKGAAEGMLGDKAGGGKNEVQKKPEDFRAEMSGILRGLPAIGPTNPQYNVERSRQFFLGELEKNYPQENWDWLKKEWANIEQQEYIALVNKLRQPVSGGGADKMTQLQTFAQNHTTVPKSDIDTLAAEIGKMEQPQQN